MIEPGPQNWKALKANRFDCLLLHAAICDVPRTVHFVEFESVGGIIEFMPESFRKEWWPHIDMGNLREFPEIPCYPLQALLQPFGIAHVHLWVLDTEGSELYILKTVN